jgi:hypothetical protein
VVKIFPKDTRIIAEHPTPDLFAAEELILNGIGYLHPDFCTNDLVAFVDGKPQR